MSAFDHVGFLFGLQKRVGPRPYAIWGGGLLALKYAVDLALSAAFAGHPLGPLGYLNPILSMRLAAIEPYPRWLPAVMALWALPFIWIGVSMTARRAVDAGKSPWLALLFFVPVVNYLVMLGLCLSRSVEAEAELPPALGDAAPVLRVALLSVGGALAFGLPAVALSFFVFKEYGSVLFLGAPFLIGMISGALLNRERRQSTGSTILVSVVSVTLCGGALLIFALEGVLCLVMASALAYPLAALGALVGRAWALDFRTVRSLVVAWPILALMPWERAPEYAVRSVVSSIDIDAPPERVWPNVVGFSELPPASEWLLKTGIACPLRAHIQGQGVGSIRYCEFSTGPFVEPITVWDPPRRLAFDVSRQPPSMREWSPYEIVYAPHTVGTMQSLHGEFRISPLPHGRSRLQGTTWYRLKMSPNGYWTLFADEVVHVIHLRVLRHVRSLSEAMPRLPQISQ